MIAVADRGACLLTDGEPGWKVEAGRLSRAVLKISYGGVAPATAAGSNLPSAVLGGPEGRHRSTLMLRHCSETLGLNLAAVFGKTVRFSDRAVSIADFVKNGHSIFQVSPDCERTWKSEFDAR